jgi:hypothetical protein
MKGRRGWRKLAAEINYPLRGFLGWLAALIGVAGGGTSLIVGITANTTIREWVLSLSLTLIVVIALLTLAYREWSRAKPTRVADTMQNQARASELLRDLHVFMRKKLAQSRSGEVVSSETILQAKASIEEILNVYSNIYSIITATKCRLSIKMVDFGDIGLFSSSEANIGEHIYVFTLARDTSSTRENKNADLKREKEKLDQLIKNTDFLSLWDMEHDDTGFFHSPDLRAEKEYESSSLTFWRTKQENPGSVAIKDWPLPYRSTIVWPIRQEPRSDLGLEGYDTVGFLAVDSPMPCAFDIGTNAPIGTILANGLHPILKLYNELDIVLKRQVQGSKTS